MPETPLYDPLCSFHPNNDVNIIALQAQFDAGELITQREVVGVVGFVCDRSLLFVSRGHDFAKGISYGGAQFWGKFQNC